MNRPDREWMKELERCAAGAPVKIHLNPPFPVLRALYGRASLFWNGTGAHRNPDAHPKDMEHFGAAIVEAMAAGCVPLAFAGGGPREIIADGKTGFLYRDWDELAKKTASAAASTRLRAMAKRARASAARFSEKRFRAELKRLLAS
jgi:glycosyltransferase involved in cell wall biosynthesis